MSEKHSSWSTVRILVMAAVISAAMIAWGRYQSVPKPTAEQRQALAAADRDLALKEEARVRPYMTAAEEAAASPVPRLELLPDTYAVYVNPKHPNLRLESGRRVPAGMEDYLSKEFKFRDIWTATTAERREIRVLRIAIKDKENSYHHKKVMAALDASGMRPATLAELVEFGNKLQGTFPQYMMEDLVAPGSEEARGDCPAMPALRYHAAEDKIYPGAQSTCAYWNPGDFILASPKVTRD
jgi:hypothetical protein